MRVLNLRTRKEDSKWEVDLMPMEKQRQRLIL